MAMGACTVAIFWTLQRPFMLITTFTLSLIWIGVLWHLIYYVQKINRELSLFLEAFRHRDSTIKFREYGKNTSFGKLYKEFNNIIDEFSRSRTETEAEHLFFENTIRHVGVGLLAFDEKGKVELQNQAFHNLLGTRELQSVWLLNAIQSDLGSRIISLRNGQQILVKLVKEDKILQLSLKATKFILQGKQVTLVSFQNIKAELDAGELEAWRKLIKVIIHEIMNSVGSINILSSSLLQIWNKNVELSSVREDSLQGLNAIKRRSHGLSRFVELYRDLYKVPEPIIKSFKWAELVSQIEILLGSQLQERGITFRCEVSPPDLTMHGDERLLEQVLINLIQNAMDALKDRPNPKIHLRVFRDRDNLYCEVEDNGTGIGNTESEQIFVPFFTTKDDGSGIGLSISRQIMRKHGGQIEVYSEPGKFTRFSLIF